MKWLKRMLSNTEDASYGRFISLVVTVCVLNWISIIIAAGSREIPDIPYGVLTLAILPFLGSKGMDRGPDILGKIAEILKGRNANPGT